MAKASPSIVTVQQKLYQLGKPALQLVRIVGYFPFTVSKKGLNASYRSVPFIWSVFLCAVALFKLVFLFVINGFNAAVELSNLDKVEAFCQLVLAAVTISAVFSFTLKGILTMKQAVHFWNRNCFLLREFTELHPSLNFCIQSNQHQKLFYKIAWKMKFPCVLIWLYGIIIPAVTGLMGMSPLAVQLTTEAAGSHGSDDSWSIMTLRAVLHASICISFLYMSLAAYMALFLMVYSACLKMIATELKQLSHERRKDGLQPPEKSLGSLYGPFLEAYIKETREVDIRNFLRAYQLIEDLVAEFNSQFSFEIILEATKSVVSILVYAFFVITRGVGPLAALVTIGPAVVMGFRLYALATEATEVKKGADGIACELQKLDMDELTVGTRAKVCTFYT